LRPLADELRLLELRPLDVDLPRDDDEPDDARLRDDAEEPLAAPLLRDDELFGFEELPLLRADEPLPLLRDDELLGFDEPPLALRDDELLDFDEPPLALRDEDLFGFDEPLALREEPPLRDEPWLRLLDDVSTALLEVRFFSPSSIVPRQAPCSSWFIITCALKRCRSARTARLMWRMPRAAFSSSEPGCTSMFTSTCVRFGASSEKVTMPVWVMPSVTSHLII
jgi:hypothetical protein